MTGIHHIALRVRDCEASARFYEGGFGLSEIRRISADGQAKAVWLRAGDTVLMLERALRGTGPAQGSGHVLIFKVKDLVAAEEAFKERGIAIMDRTTNTLYVEDPDGHRSGVSIFSFDERGS
ncbi:MAG: VOC family protein [Vicinamibacteria bacterium]